MPAPLPVVFEVPAGHRVRRSIAVWISIVLAVAWIAVAATLATGGVGPDPLSLLPPAGLFLITIGAALALPRLIPARASALRVEPARLVTEDQRGGTRKFPAHKVTAVLGRDGGELILTLDDAERRRPANPVRVVLAPYGTTDPAKVAKLLALARVLSGAPDAETRRTVSALGGEADTVTLAR
ncbi:hypothetical protein AB0I28_11785 [Phytomonospora sp. NPDC050363]|uniref:hypothetical protein n=1 Tax=Phytomonospora sp. NPDC050363 TaxID=3155642 RepID=UPI0033FD676A